MKNGTPCRKASRTRYSTTASLIPKAGSAPCPATTRGRPFVLRVPPRQGLIPCCTVVMPGHAVLDHLKRNVPVVLENFARDAIVKDPMADLAARLLLVHGVILLRLPPAPPFAAEQPGDTEDRRHVHLARWRK